MVLSYKGLEDKKAWEDKGIKLPCFDIAKMKAKTEKAPEWIHFGAGNIFRGFIGSIAQDLLNKGEMETGIIAVESFDFDIIDKIYKPFDNLTLNVMMGKDSSLNMEVLASIADGIKSSEFDKLRKIAENPSLKMISFTITEKGYAVKDLNGNLMKVVQDDINGGLDNPKHTMSIIASLLYYRYLAGRTPVAVVSMDNCSHNGEKLKAGVMTVAKAWVEAGVCEGDYLDYVDNTVSFPWSMIDKITPRPDNKIKEVLEKAGVKDMAPVVTDKNTFIAPFVNAEIPQYLVIEDDFPNGRANLERAGVYLTDRQTVNKAETMKVTTCLNPLHTALAVFGCILGYTTIWEEMQDKDLRNLVEKIKEEGMKVVINPGIIDPLKFVDEVINDRLPNPFIPDAPQRIATDTSQKIPVRYGETVKAYAKSDLLNPADLEAIPMVMAGYLRYLLAKDDNGADFVPSSDPMMSELQAKLEGVKIGDPDSCDGKLEQILSNEHLFGTDLYKAGLAKKVETYFKSMIKGEGAVRATLQTL